MQRYILTGAPGAGKTTILHLLRGRGYAVVAEAATDIIAREQATGHAEPWTRDGFVDQIVALQRDRQENAPDATPQFFDRSPICTHALSTYLGREPSALLRAEVERITREAVYQRQVFFVANLGFCEPTAARRISFEDSLAFERIHRATYRAFGFDLIEIAAAPAPERADAVIRWAAAMAG